MEEVERSSRVSENKAQPTIAIDFVWENQSWVPVRRVWVPCYNKLAHNGRGPFDAYSTVEDGGKSLLELFQTEGLPPHSSDNLGLPPGWKWIGPWVIDSDNFGTDRFLREDEEGAEKDPEGWIYGGYDWPRDEQGYYRNRGRARLVRCRRWVRPREYLPNEMISPNSVEEQPYEENESKKSSKTVQSDDNRTSEVGGGGGTTAVKKGILNLEEEEDEDILNAIFNKPVTTIDSLKNTPQHTKTTDNQVEVVNVNSREVEEEVEDTIKDREADAENAEPPMTGEEEADWEYGCLLEFYHSCGGSGWVKNKGWSMALRELSTWVGLEMMRRDVIGGGDRGGSEGGLAGVLLVNVIDLSRNNLRNSIPEFLGEFRGLSVLDLSHNHLTGSIPQSFGEFASIQRINLSHNELSGSFPTELTRLSQLQELTLTQNALTGEIPGEVGIMVGLEVLRLDNNLLTGTPPASLTKLTSLEELCLANNEAMMLEDAMTWMASLPRLKHLDVLR